MQHTWKLRFYKDYFRIKLKTIKQLTEYF